MEFEEPKRAGVNEFIRRMRQGARVSQQEISAKFGIPQSTYSRFESGEGDLAMSVILKIKEHLDAIGPKWGRLVSLNSLLSANPTPEPADPRKLSEIVADQLEDRYKTQMRLYERRQHEEDMREAKELDEIVDEKYPALKKENAALKAEIEALKSKVSELEKSNRPRKRGKK